MKKTFLLAAMLLATLAGNVANAQVSLQVNIGVQPLWGPVGYDHASYYYLPDVDAYYDVQAQQYVYMEGNSWVTRPQLPPRYANYDLYHGYKAVINEPQPWMHHDKYRAQYASYRGHHDQQAIRDSHEDKYRANPHHPEHGQYKGGHGPREGQGHQDNGHHDNGHGNEHGNGHDNGHHDEHGR